MKYKYQATVFLSLLLATPLFSRCQSNSPTFSSEDYLVSSTVSKLLTPDGQPLKTNTIYQVGLVTLGTGTHTGSSFIAWKDNITGNWKVRNVSLSGTTSNNPLLEIDSNNTVVVRTNHPSKYTVRSFVESFPVGVPTAIPSLMGSSFQWQREITNLVYMDGNVGIGTNTPNVKLAVNGTINTKEVNVTTTNWPDYVFKATTVCHHWIPYIQRLKSQGIFPVYQQPTK